MCADIISSDGHSEFNHLRLTPRRGPSERADSCVRPALISTLLAEALFATNYLLLLTRGAAPPHT